MGEVFGELEIALVRRFDNAAGGAGRGVVRE